MRYDRKTDQFVPYLDGISAIGVVSSHDGVWVAYVTYPKGNLWVSKADGSQKFQLTFAPLEVIAPRWARDGKQLAFMGRNPGEAWRIYTIAAENGGTAQIAVHGDASQAAPDWSPDGNSIVFGGLPQEVTGDSKETSIHLLDLRTHVISAIPGSEGFYCPRWSPNGRFISASTADGLKLVLFDSAAQKWATLADLSSGCPTWSQDSQFLYFQLFDVANPEFVRIRVSDGKREHVAPITFRRVENIWYRWWTGLTSDDAPVVLRDEGEDEIYTLDWELP